MTRRLATILVAALAAAPAVAGTLHDPAEAHLADVRQLTFTGDNAEAYWSSDGTRLIFQSTRKPFDCDQIFEMPAFEKGEAKLVSSGRGRTTCSYFFPGDQKILWSATDDHASACPPRPDLSQGYVWRVDPDYEIYVADPDGSHRVRLTDNRAYDAEATICSRDGSILFTSDRDGDLDLYRMDADGSNVKRLTDTPGYDGGGFFSADCSKIVWRASRPRGEALDTYQKLLAQGLVRPSQLELWVADADGGNAHQVTHLGVASFAPYFYPDGQRIVFSSNYGDPKGREFDIWAIDVQGTRLERLTYTGGFDGFPIFSPDGKWLAFASNRNQAQPGETDIYVARWTDAPVTPTVELPADRFQAAAAWLSDDAREGRGIGTQGLADAGAWLEVQFRALGLAPAGEDGSYRQPFSVETEVRSAAQTSVELDGRALAADQYVPTAFASPGPASGDLVVAGWGITSQEPKHDDYAALDVKGKVVLVRRFVPPGDEFRGTEMERRWGDLRYKAFNAREHGAVALLVADLPIPDPAHPEDIPPDAPLPRLRPEDGGDVGIPVVVLTRDAARPLFDGAHSARLAVQLERDYAPTFNVVGRLDPAGSPVDDRVVVIGAHYDHLGYGGPASLEPGSHEIHNGADDNASGVAAVLEAARSLAARRSELRRPVVFVAFSGEERGTLGSTFFVRHPPAGLAVAKLAAMVNLDMVGRLRQQKLTVFGIDTAAEWKDEVDRVCASEHLDCQLNGDGYGPSDHTPFYAAGVPVLYLFTGTHDQYHRPSDDAALLNATGGAEIAKVAARFVFDIDTGDRPPTLREAPAPPPPSGDVRSYGASMGTIPDYGGPGEGRTGVLLAGVRPGGPADQAGLRRGDILIGLAGREIRNVEDFVYVLRQAHPGERALAIILRDGKRLEVQIKFGQASRRI